MDEDLKKRIMQRYLAQKSQSSATTVSEEALANDTQLAKALEYIAQHHDALFNMATLEANKAQWEMLCDILNYSCFFTKDSPPILKSVNDERIHFALNHWKNTSIVKKLPQDDYYKRTVSTPETIDLDLGARIAAARNQLYSLTQTMPNSIPFLKDDTQHILKQIDRLQNEIQQLDKLKSATDTQHEDKKKRLEHQLLVFQDLNKINNLKPVTVPNESGASQIYYKLAEATKGVTEKVALISAEKVSTQLYNLELRQGLTIDSYINERDQFKLSTQAMLKLPKHQKIIEVLREAIALNISRLLGLNTARSTSVCYNNQPALFIPFDPIKELNQYATGELFKPGLGLGNETYSHYSTINPVGEGLQADRFIDDFGSSLALFYLSSDTDAIGGYCQNKALTNDKELFIFDQVIMDTDKFKLDSRLSLVPCQAIMKHTRHGQGRNRTLIEDSSIDSKFASLMQLKEHQEQITRYLDRTILQHKQRRKVLEALYQGKPSPQEKQQIISEADNIDLLIKDALQIKTKVQQRISAIDDVLPKTKGCVTNDEVKQALILEKLLHNPVLFNKLGRPYKNPWTSRQDQNVLSISTLENDRMLLSFNRSVSSDLCDYIKKSCGIDSLTAHSPTTLTISRAQLNSLTENMLHPERRTSLEMNTNYLDLSLIQQAYTNGVNKDMLQLIIDYKKVMQGDGLDNEKITCISETIKGIQRLITVEQDKGFGMHLLNKLQFDVQQQLRKLIPEQQLPTQLDDAFNAALKLDRVGDFNQGVAEAIARKRVNNIQFLDFLGRCVQHGHAATNHKNAISESQDLHKDAEELLTALNQPIPILAQLMIQQQADDSLSSVNPIDFMEDNLDEQLHILMKPLNIPPDLEQGATIKEDDVEINNPPVRQRNTIPTM